MEHNISNDRTAGAPAADLPALQGCVNTINRDSGLRKADFRRSLDLTNATLVQHGFSADYPADTNSTKPQLSSIVKHIMDDACQTGTRFFRLATDLHFDDGGNVHYSLNFLFNKETEILKLHSVGANLGGVSQLFLIGKDQSMHSALEMKQALEQQKRLMEAHRLLDVTTSIRSLTL